MKTAAQPDVAQRLRQEGAERFAALGWPTTRLEEWKYTSLANVAKIQWKEAAHSGAAVESPASLRGSAVVELIFVNGRFAGMTGEHLPGVSIGPLLSNLDAPSVATHLGKHARTTVAMTALNAAHMQDGALIDIADGTALEGFIHLLFIGSGESVWSHPRNLIVAGRASEVTVVETFAGSGRYFTNAVTEIVAGAGAVIDHYKVVCDSDDAFHVATVQIHQQQSSSVTSHSVSIGGALVRNDISGVLAGPGASLTLDGLFVVNGSQHTDTHTLIDHASPNCQSNELYKGVLDGTSRGVFDGRIVVRPDAQKTVSRQENRNLLLSETAIVDSKPTLEIHNDDVKCNHGSTIGQIDDETMFYLRSRGISEDEARALLVLAFASQIVDRMKIEPVREQIRRLLFKRMPGRLPERKDNDR